MDGYRNKGRDADVVDSAISRAVRNVRKMHSFDRRIKIAHQHQNPDLDTDVPSYMRQTCASLIKRSSSKPRDVNLDDLKSPKKKESKKGKKINEKTTSKETDENVLQTRRSVNDIFDRKPPRCHVSPRSELSAVAEDSNNDRSPRSPDKTLREPPSEGTMKLTCRDIDVSSPEDACHAHALKEARITDSVSPWRVLDGDRRRTRGPSISSSITLEDAHSEIAHDDSSCQVYESDQEDGTTISATDSIFTSSYFHATCSFPQSPLATHSAQLNTGDSDDTVRVLHETQWSEDESESDDGDFNIDHLEKEEDEEEDEEEEEDHDHDHHCKDLKKVESHRLTDLLASFTDSEFGDDFSQLLMATDEANLLAAQQAKLKPYATDNSEGRICLPIKEDCNHEADDKDAMISESNKCQFSNTDSNKLAESDGSYQIRGPGLFWMLGGNLLAGVVGAAIASAGIPLSAQHTTPGNEGDATASNGDDVHADDWFFQASSRVNMGA